MKKIFIGFLAILFGGIAVYAISDGFKIDCSNLSFLNNSKEKNVLDNFNKSYALSTNINTTNDEIYDEITELTKKTTYLLLGDFNNEDESYEEYYKRHQDYLNMGAYQTYPKDENSESGYDESSPNYKYAMLSEFAIPSIFLQFSDAGIKYDGYGDIKIVVNDDLIISSIILPNIKMKTENSDNPEIYDYINTNLMIVYFFLKIDNEYKLSYFYGETFEQINSYLNNLEETENNLALQIAPSYESNLQNIYDYSKVESLSSLELNNIYEMNKTNVVYLTAYYNNYIVSIGNGFFINNGLIVTTWNFLENALINGQYITINDSNGLAYEIDGIVTINPDTDVAVIKLKDKVERKVNIGNYKELNIEDPVISITSKTGVGLTMQTGIVISLDGYIQTSIPLASTDEGSPLFDKEGNIIGINTSKLVNADMSMAVNSDILNEIIEKFININFDDIETISFDKLKESYYYVKYNDEIIKNNIPSDKWKQYSKIGNIENNINVELIKASYKDGIISLRYINEISNLIGSMQLANKFKEELINEGFKEVLNGATKCIYTNDKYKIIIMDEFNYLIVVMVKL